jgi:hypothetical protein
MHDGTHGVVGLACVTVASGRRIGAWAKRHQGHVVVDG